MIGLGLGLIKKICLAAVALCDFSTFSRGPNIPFVMVDGEMVPATGPMHFVMDYLKAVFTTVNIADGTDRFLRGKIRLDSSLSETVMVHNYTGADNVSPSCRLQYEVANGIRGLWFDDSNVLKGTTDWIAVSLNVELVYNFVFNSSSTMNLTINGVSGIPRAATAGGVCNVFAEYWGAYSATLFRAPMYGYECDSCIVGFSNTVNRLPSENDPKGNVIDTSTAIDRTVTDNDPKGIFYPHEIEGTPVHWPTDFVVSDTPCPDNPLFIGNDGLAVQGNDGIWLPFI